MTEGRILYRGVVHPWECDAMGHLTTRFYMAMFDDASWHFFHELGYDAALQDQGIGWADVSHKIEYLAEIRAGSLVIIHGHPLRLGNKSVEYVLEMRAASTDEPVARLTAVSVQFDTSKRCAIPVRGEVRDGVSAWIDGS